MINIQHVLSVQRQFFNKGQTNNISFRLNCLKELRKSIQLYENQIVEALQLDFKKPEVETYLSELSVTISEIKFIEKNIYDLTGKQFKDVALATFPSSQYTIAEPYGVCLIIAPWNYPFYLAMAPLISAVAAGNCAIIKPSEFTSNTSRIIHKIINEVFEEGHVSVIEGDKTVAEELLKHKFDYIFFTGSTRVGKAVMQAAAQHLTPVTLELGGKSPCVVDETCDIKRTGKIVAWAKTLNAGQTCVAPDYVLVHRNVREAFVTSFKVSLTQFFGKNILQNEDFCSIINAQHFKRLIGYLENADIIFGGESEAENCKISPTLILNPDENWPVMQDEIFGPILPIIEYDDFDDVIKFIRNRPKPLSAYLFSKNSRNQMLMEEKISAGSMLINDAIVHLANHALPFGGVGDSGIGNYHGKYGFYTFSHQKSVMKRATWLDIPIRFAPYNRYKNLIKKIYPYL
jgi:aldehyde dehydrogenase (NAD+)